jgi:hypothetical protein
MDSGEEKAASKRKFDAISWIWDILILDRVARSALNRSHVGVIMTGDLNQRYEHRGHRDNPPAGRESVSRREWAYARIPEQGCRGYNVQGGVPCQEITGLAQGK